MSVQAVITQVPGTVGTMQQALCRCVWSGSMRLPSAFSSLSTFALQDDKQQLWPVFEIAWLTVLPTRQTHKNYLLIGPASTICWTCQHVSSCLTPLLQKKSHPLTAGAVCCSFSFLELEERKRMKPFLWASVDSSLTCLFLEDAIKFPKVWKAYIDVCIYIYMFIIWI